jgi:CheY-like chemotaxis protein
MPNQDGWETLQLLKNDPDTGHIPVVICSVLEDPDLAISLGAAGYLAKPVTQTKLVMMLNQLA